MYADFDVYRQEYEKYDVLSDLDMSMDDAMDVTRQMMAYLRGEGDTLSVITTVDGRAQDFFNEQDRFHMGEVRDLFIGGLNIRTGALVIAVLCILLLILTKADLKKVIPAGYQAALAVTAAALLFLGSPVRLILTPYSSSSITSFSTTTCGSLTRRKIT